MSDTPVHPEQPPVARIDMLKAFIGDLARPFAIIATSYAAAHATIVTAYRVQNGTDGALLLAAIFAGVGALYTAKSVEVWKVAKAGEGK